MGRKPCCDKVGLKRGPWTMEEDHKLTSFILSNGIHCWRAVPKLAGLLRCGKSCRLRWINYLRPDLKRGNFTEAEEDQIIHLHETLGNKWSKIASHFEGRTDNEIKNHWNTRIKKIVKEKGLDTTKSQKSTEPKQTEKAAALALEIVNVENQDEEGHSKKVVKKLKQNNDKQKAMNELENDDDDDDLLSNYEIFNGKLEVIEHCLNEEIMELDVQSSSIASIQDSLIASLSEQISPGLLENPWFDEMESFFTFSDHLADDQLFSPKHDQSCISNIRM